MEVVGGENKINFWEYILMKYHIQHINNKISRSLFIINKVKNFLPKATLQFAITEIVKHLNFEKRAVRIINKMAHRSHTDPCLKPVKN